MIKQLSILLLICFGFILFPKVSLACHNKHRAKVEDCCEKSDKSCCAKENSCCDQHAKNNSKDDGCQGNCGHGSCHCPSTSNVIVPSLAEDLTCQIFPSEKESFYLPDFKLPQGVDSTWLPPKIS